MEKWRDIPGYAHHYQISDDGVVRLIYTVEDRPKHSPVMRTLRQHVSDFVGRQPTVRLLTKDGKYERVRVIRLMRDIWMNGKIKGYVVSHIDTNAFNNALYNLQYTTRREVAAIGAKYNRKPVVKVDKEGNAVEVYPSIIRAAEAEHICRSAISNMCNHKLKYSIVTGGEFTFVFSDEYYK